MTEVGWILPDGGTPEAVTWPQVLVSPESLAAVPCGSSVWVQWDTYPDEAVAGLVADGLLTQGEDAEVGLVGWRFELVSGACEPTPTPVPTVTPTVTPTPTAHTALDLDTLAETGTDPTPGILLALVIFAIAGVLTVAGRSR